MQECSRWVGWLILSCMGSAMHFVYRWLGCFSYIALFVAVNESVWEHLKLLVWPLLLWWLFSLLWRDLDDCIHGLLMSELYSVSTMLITYYTYMGIFDYESLAVDIIIFLLSLLVGLSIAEETELYSRFNTILCLVIFFVFFICMSLVKPELPLFFDKAHDTYGPVC